MLWGQVADYLSVRYLTETGTWSHDSKDGNTKALAGLKEQFTEIASRLNDRTISIIVKCMEGLGRYEESARGKLAMVTESAAAFLKSHKDALKSGAVDFEKLDSTVIKAQELIKKQDELFKTLKSAKIVVVEGNKEWQDAEIKLREGEVVTSAAYGFVTGGSAGRMSPDGIDEYKEFRPLKEGNYGALIARQEGMEKGFLRLGIVGSFEADRTGLLMLRANYSDFGSKAGAFLVVIGVEKRKKRQDD